MLPYYLIVSIYLLRRLRDVWTFLLFFSRDSSYINYSFKIVHCWFHFSFSSSFQCQLWIDFGLETNASANLGQHWNSVRIHVAKSCLYVGHKSMQHFTSCWILMSQINIELAYLNNWTPSTKFLARICFICLRGRRGHKTENRIS